MYDVAPDGQKFLMIKPAGTTEEGAHAMTLSWSWFEELKRLVTADG